VRASAGAHRRDLRGVAVLSRGLTAYTITTKVRHLAWTARRRSRSTRFRRESPNRWRGGVRLFRSDIAVATTAMPTGAGPRRDTPVTFWALAHRRADNVFVLRQGRIDGGQAARVEMQKVATRRGAGGLDQPPPGNSRRWMKRWTKPRGCPKSREKNRRAQACCAHSRRARQVRAPTDAPQNRFNRLSDSF